MMAIQFIGFIGLYVVMINRLTKGGATDYEEAVNLPTAGASLFEIYSYEYRYWTFIELFYDCLNTLFLNMSSRGNGDLYWLNIFLHAAYTYLHATQKPSMYSFHNWLNIAVGGAHLFGDIGVLESIYGAGRLSANGVWWLLCAVIPVVVALARFIWKRCQREKNPESQSQDAVWVKKLTAVENHCLTEIYYFLLYMSATGLIFLHVASICGWKRPGGWWIGQYVWTPICTLAIYILPGAIIYYQVDDKAWADLGDTIADGCRAVFCWWTSIQIYPE
jgi:hypothetical protein